MTRACSVDLLLDRCNTLQSQRDRAIAQRASYESHLWFAESLLKRLGKLLPELIAVSPRDVVVRDTLCQEIAEFISEPRHHPGLPGESVDEDARLLGTTDSPGKGAA